MSTVSAANLHYGDSFFWLGWFVQIIDVRPANKGFRLFQVVSPVNTVSTIEVPETMLLEIPDEG